MDANSGHAIRGLPPATDELGAPDWSGPTKASVKAQSRRAAQAQQAARNAEELAAWRRRNPTATCNDHVAQMLSDMEKTYSRRAGR